MQIEVTALNQEIFVITNENDIVTTTTVDPSPSNTAIQFQDEGVNLGTRGTVQTVDFTGAGVSASRLGDKVTVTVTSTGGGGGHTIQQNGTSLSQRTNLNIKGTLVAKDDSANDATTVDSPAGNLFMYYNFY